MITEKAFAKINLTLSVGEKRKDGYTENWNASRKRCSRLKRKNAGNP